MIPTKKKNAFNDKVESQKSSVSKKITGTLLALVVSGAMAHASADSSLENYINIINSDTSFVLEHINAPDVVSYHSSHESHSSHSSHSSHHSHYSSSY